MPRYFIGVEQLHDGRITLSPTDSHHFARVLRHEPGARFTAVFGGQAYEAVAEQVDRQAVVGRVLEATPVAVPPLAVTLCQALPKGDKMEWIVQKATELGVARIRPVRTARAVVQLQGDRAEARVERWQKIAEEAAEQAEREAVPEVLPISDLASSLEPGALSLVLAERAETLTLPRALPPEPPARLMIYIGPEGGWAPEELAWLRERGVVDVSLGKRILRTETAGLAALAIVLATYELR